MRKLFVNTPKDFIAQLPRAEYKGRIVVIQSVEEVRRAVHALSKSSILGFDSETRPNFKKGKMNKVALLQICDANTCFLFRVNQFGLPADLVELLSRKDILKVGLSLKDDFQQMRSRQAFMPNGFIDLQTTAKEMGLQDMSLQKLYANFCHERISKSAQLSNWEADVLTPAQKSYAALDAYACLRLYYEMGQLQQSGDYIVVDELQ